MKLKNKKTGETGYYLHTHRDYKTGALKVAVLKDGVPFSELKPYEPIYDYDSLAELNEEWCDYEEPKEYWFIDEFGLVQKEIEYYYEENKEAVHDKRIAVGNYFSSREEAEKVVEKLKAFKRLKDKGFRFTGYTHKDRGRLDELEIYCQLGECPENIEEMDDVHLLFGGEE